MTVFGVSHRLWGALLYPFICRDGRTYFMEAAMADETITESASDVAAVGTHTEQAEGSLEALGDAGKKALQAEREARKQAEAARKDIETQLADAQKRVQDFEDANKTEIEKASAAVERANSQIAEVEARAIAAETALLRYEVAQEKGITGKALDLLVGSTREELETKADSILSIVRESTTAAPVVTQEGVSPTKVGGPEQDFANAMHSIFN